MLISQRLAKDFNFLKMQGATPDELFQLRLKVIRAVKFLVGTHLLANDQYIRDVRKQLYGADQPEPEVLRKKNEMWAKYARPPFPLTVLENPEALLLIEELSDGWWRLTRIGLSGRAGPVSIRVNNVVACRAIGTAPGPCLGKEVWVRDQVAEYPALDRLRAQWRIDAHPLPVQQEFVDNISEHIASMECNLISASELLLLINVANSHIHHYTPSKRENAMVPKALLPHYSYRLVDIFRNRKVYHSFDQMLKDVTLSVAEASEKRAHLVRGHFKEKKNGLFWWSPFVRCRKNATTVGVVEKDYQLVN